MFERYGENARRTISFARFEAAQLGSPDIAPEHILLGLLRDHRSLVWEIIGSSSEQIREETLAGLRDQKKSSPPVLSLSRQSQELLAAAREEADRFGEKNLSNDHIFLALTGMENCLSAQVLRRRGLSDNRVRDLLSTYSHRTLQAPPSRSAGADLSLPERELHELQERVLKLFQANEYQNALKLIDDAIADPSRDHRQTIRTLAGVGSLIARIAGDHDLARRYCEQRVACDPDDAMALYELADCLSLQGMTEEANKIAYQSYNLTSKQSTPQNRSLAELIEHRFRGISSTG